MSEAWIIDACRTPRGIGKKGKGALANEHPQPLGAFELDDDGKAVAADPPRDDDEAIARAAGACPRFAIALVRSRKAGPQPKTTST